VTENPPTCRVPLIDESSATNDLAATFARVRKSVKAVPRIYEVLGNAPALLNGWIEFGWGLRQDASSDRELRELAIMRVAQLTGCEYVWRSHYQMAVSAGVRPASLSALAAWRSSELFSEAECAVLAVTDALTADAAVPDDVWAGVDSRFDDREKVEIVLTISWYACAARVANGLQVPLEEWHSALPPMAGSG
jgi:AhpD family alkylhydroperoxidase